MDSSFIPFFAANSLTSVVLPVPFGPMIRTNRSAAYALSKTSKELFQSMYNDSVSTIGQGSFLNLKMSYPLALGIGELMSKKRNRFN